MELEIPHERLHLVVLERYPAEHRVEFMKA